MTRQVIAFDIDGTLTLQNNLSLFKTLQSQEDKSVGIVTSNPPLLANSFIDRHNLNPEFQYNALVKARAFFMLDKEYPNSHKLYVGNSRTDKTYSRISGWDFIESTDDSKLSELS